MVLGVCGFKKLEIWKNPKFLGFYIFTISPRKLLVYVVYEVSLTKSANVIEVAGLPQLDF